MGKMGNPSRFFAGPYEVYEPRATLMFEYAVESPDAKNFEVAVHPRLIRQTTKAYSTISWPSSRLKSSCNLTYSLSSIVFTLSFLQSLSSPPKPEYSFTSSPH